MTFHANRCREIGLWVTALALTAGASTPPPPATQPTAAKPTTAPAPVARPAVPPAAPTLPPTGLSVDAAKLPTTPGYHVVKFDGRMDGKAVRFKFGLFLPAGYDHGSQGWPIVMSLHNKGFIGGDANGSLTLEGLPYLLTHDQRDGRWSGDVPPKAIDLKNGAPFVCLAPQCPTGHTWDDPAMLTMLDQLLEAVVEKCHGDPQRTYLTGFSFGGSNTWLVGADLAGHFAAIAPLDGRATADPVATVSQLMRTGVYQVVGERDNDFKPEAKRMVAALAAVPHPDFCFHVVPGGNHYCYGSIYTDPTFWAWMFAHHRTPPAHAAATAAAVPVVPAAVAVALDPKLLPRMPGYAVVRPTVTLNGQTLSVPVGVWLPPGFPRVAAPLPLIVSLHNRYAIGMDGSNGALLGEGLPMILSRGNPNHGEHGDVPARPLNPATGVAFIGLFPQCPANQKWESAAMPEVIDKLVAAVLAGYGTAGADPDRVYCTGWSYGASSTWAVATADPGRFAAIAINDGRAMPDPTAAVDKLKNVGIYLAVGERDGEFVDEERRMLDALCAARHVNFVHRVVAHGDHQAYEAVYADPAFWGWLLAQRRHR